MLSNNSAKFPLAKRKSNEPVTTYIYLNNSYDGVLKRYYYLILSGKIKNPYPTLICSGSLQPKLA